jgi:hypothetical protein
MNAISLMTTQFQQRTLIHYGLYNFGRERYFAVDNLAANTDSLWTTQFRQ